MGDEFTLEDVLIILKRRLLFFLLPALILAPLGVVIVLLLPSKYTAQGTILVESAQIPSDLVRSTVNAYAQERIQTIRQRVMTRNRLLEIADKYQLFPKEKGLSESERVRRMRERLKVALIMTEGARATGQRDNTIAFNVSYIDRSPDSAFRVANEFMSAFLTEDVRARTAGASNTTEFFKQEVQRLATQAEATEKKIADYKAANSTSLPEHLSMHLNTLERFNRDLAAQDAAIVALEEEVRFLETQLASQLAGGGAEQGPAQELVRLKSELVQLRAVYQDAHPSVQAARDQIRALEAELRPSKEVQNLQAALAQAEEDLRIAEKEFPAGDPAIADKRTELTRIQDGLSEKISRAAATGGGGFLSAQIQGRIAVARSRRNLIETQREETSAELAELQARISRTPEVERGLQALTRDQENIEREYKDVLAKQQDAQLAENLEDNQKAEKFSILEAALRPEKPSSPERAKLIVLAIFGALGVGGVVALGAEILAATIRGRAHLEGLIEGHAIAIIPQFGEEEGFFKVLRRFSARAAPASAAAAVAVMTVTPVEQTGEKFEDVGDRPAAETGAVLGF
ncbi:MAG: hypothetical protein WD076_07240 [Parvularculaceae bacterium]